MVLRAARPEECDEVGALTLAAYLQSGLVDDGSDYAGQLQAARQRAEQAELIVAVDAVGALLGTVTFCLPGTPYAEISQPGEAEFRMLAVTAAARSRGIARTLVEECVTRARRGRSQRLLLCTQARNATSIRLYERLGFVRAPERDWEPQPGLLLLAYALDLTR